MGQKVNPHGLRVGVIKDWDSRWYARNELVGDLLVEDKKIRDYLKKTLYGAGIPKIEIERDNAKVRIYLHCARPGVVIGKGGEEIKAIEAKLVKMIGKPVDLKIVLDLIRGKDVATAVAILMQTPKAASEPVLKLLKSAAANAENNHQMDPEKLYVSQVFATPGPILKRMMPRAQGRAYRINKRTSHITIAVAER